MYASLHDKSLQLCLTLCDLMDCGLPVSSVHQSLQASMLEGVVTPSSRGPSLRTASPASSASQAKKLCIIIAILNHLSTLMEEKFWQVELKIVDIHGLFF